MVIANGTPIDPAHDVDNLEGSLFLLIEPVPTAIVSMTLFFAVLYAVCNFLSDLTPNPFPCKEGEQESKPLSLWGRGMEAGF
ncbi:hypothetical protein H6G97_22430 [Nostoc flagelliforme FACHB-838]|uniref:Uncharacterized protein n=1 Tax=Nostoc flagelliforme FACHB-838 TaxID=2692904 RepID=A0ABR8DRU7_9NOSO|nr:hypothetical protein [Nostoc flagelliforme]MBD2532187.1 hypothetical protein [Nostoc flagelliforme FACHB-838]